MSRHELNEAIHARIVEICDRGDKLVDEGKLEPALAKFKMALSLVPDPIRDWEAATWVLTAIGDVHFLQGRYEEARSALNEAMHCPGGIGNPFLHLRLGEANYELKDFKRAQDELARAYMGGGDEVFDGEDPKYRNYIVEILRPEES